MKGGSEETTATYLAGCRPIGDIHPTPPHVDQEFEDRWCRIISSVGDGCLSPDADDGDLVIAGYDKEGNSW